MGSAEEAGITPDAQAPASVTKADSINMDLYIDPVKERKMMLKFDVSTPSRYHERSLMFSSRSVP